MTSEDPPDHEQANPPALPPRGRDGKGKYIRTIENAETDARAARLRTAGKTYREIAEEMGFADHTSARDAVLRALAAVPAEDGAAARQVELERLDRLVAKVTEVLERAHLAYNNRGVVEYPEGVPVMDDGPVMAAAATLQRLSESRRKLLGLDAEQKVSVSGAVTYEVVGVDPAAIAGTAAPVEGGDGDAAGG